jgi:hypothetical protein
VTTHIPFWMLRFSIFELNVCSVRVTVARAGKTLEEAPLRIGQVLEARPACQNLARRCPSHLLLIDRPRKEAQLAQVLDPKNQ